jgi:hypothetical protein
MLYQGTLRIAPMSADDEGKLTVSGEYQKVPTPQTYGWSCEDLDSEEGTGRNNASGEMFRDRVAMKRKLSFTWPPLSIEETSRLLKAINPDGEGNVFISVEYLDAREGDYVTKTFYAGPQSANCGHRSRWLGITANLIEK